ncbi:MAG: siroheme synthase CysG [Alphaproteobacteria bacterium]|nr:siroheme synthase CysG [Alphaproteobacteria bacterium]
MQELPINLNLRGKKVVVSGGGIIAARRVEAALKAGANVLVVAPSLGPDFHSFADHACFRHRAGQPQPRDFEGALLAYGASDDDATDRLVYTLASELGVLVNVYDKPECCDFSTPAILDRSPLLVAVSSAGASPLLARMIKERLESLIPASYGQLAQFLGSIRDEVATRIADPRERRHFLERMLDSPIADLAMAGNETRARELLAEELAVIEAKDASAATLGEVYLVGAGPGDPDLLTFRAMRLMQRADVVVYDRLIGSQVLDLVRRDAERVYVGKRRNQHELPQEDISRLLVTLAKQGKRVLRLKGGDPFIFGRGGEEIEMLADEGIPFQVVPGVTAASGCASYAGIPLTHRDHAQVCIFVTGHAKNGRPDLDWPLLIQPNQTVAIYMGLAMLPGLTREFIDRGASLDTPVAVVDNGTRQNQQVITGTIATIAESVAAAGIKGPAITFIGSVVRLHEKFAWFRPHETTAQKFTTEMGKGGNI